MKVWHRIYYKLITKQNVFRGYKEFLVGKSKKKDVIRFDENKLQKLASLRKSLIFKTYRPQGYSEFYVRDPKTRIIHKAQVVDRVVHHIVSDQLEEIFEPTFIYHSYACRKKKGTHRGVLALQKMGMSVSRNNKRNCWILKCDIKKFFASMNHQVLLKILSRKIKDKDFLDLLSKIIDSFVSDRTLDMNNKKGVPIGNLTSQFFSNVYLNELDQYVKNTLRVRHYIRYADDFVFLSEDREYLKSLVDPIREFLKSELDLELHPQKIIMRKFRSGVDFLGYVIFPTHILPRTKTRRRLLRKIRGKIYDFKKGKISEESLNQTVQSYFGFLVHANAHKFKEELQNLIWYWLTE